MRSSVCVCASHTRAQWAKVFNKKRYRWTTAFKGSWAGGISIFSINFCILSLPPNGDGYHVFSRACVTERSRKVRKWKLQTAIEGKERNATKWWRGPGEVKPASEYPWSSSRSDWPVPWAELDRMRTVATENPWKRNSLNRTETRNRR